MPLMPRDLQMDLKAFIEEVEKRETLWANKHKQDKVRRAQEWMDLVRTMFKDRWDSWNKVEKDKMIEHVQKRWRSVRDNIVKQIRREEKTKLGCPLQRKAPYIYFDNCRFLIPEISAYGRTFVWTKLNKHIQSAQKGKQSDIKKETSSSSDDEIDTNDPLAEYDNSSSESDYEPLKKLVKKESPKKKSSLSTKITASSSATYKNAESSSIVDKSNYFDSSKSRTLFKDGSSVNEDEAFFMSLIPSVQKLSEEQKMEFRISVLKLLKNIKQTTTANCSTNEIVELFDL